MRYYIYLSISCCKSDWWCKCDWEDTDYNKAVFRRVLVSAFARVIQSAHMEEDSNGPASLMDM